MYNNYIMLLEVSIKEMLISTLAGFDLGRLICKG